MPVFDNAIELIGNTPMVRTRHFDTGVCELYLKLESQNPTGSIKDRIGLSMIEAAEADGSLKEGGTVVEGTAGNTGLALALVAHQKGYRCVVVVPDKMTREKVQHLRAMGAEVILTRSDVSAGHPEHYQSMARQFAADTPGAYHIDQFANPANPIAHERSTGPEILAQMDGRLDALVCGVGSAGTMTGLSRYFARESPATEMILADPAGSLLAEFTRIGRIESKGGSYEVEGIGGSEVPPVADLSRVSRAYTISDRDSLLMARQLLEREGILGGSSSGTCLAAALAYCQQQREPKRVVTFVCDSGTKYFSKLFDDQWMRDRGFLESKRQASTS